VPVFVSWNVYKGKGAMSTKVIRATWENVGQAGGAKVARWVWPPGLRQCCRRAPAHTPVPLPCYRSYAEGLVGCMLCMPLGTAHQDIAKSWVPTTCAAHDAPLLLRCVLSCDTGPWHSAMYHLICTPERAMLPTSPDRFVLRHVLCHPSV
jgi:hypothetical protein